MDDVQKICPSPPCSQDWAGEGAPKRRERGGHQGYTPLALARAKSLRHNQTDQEKRLWQALRAHRFSHFKFRRQQPMGAYIIDFICHAEKVIVELDGEQHGHDGAQKRDAARTAYLQRSGYQVSRFWNLELIQNWPGILDTIYAALTSPSPLAGEGARLNEPLGANLVAAGEGSLHPTDPSPAPSEHPLPQGERGRNVLHPMAGKLS